MKIMIPFSLFLSAKSSWTGPPLWGFPEGQPHRERLLWPRVSEHADELGTYISKCVFCFPFKMDTQEYPGSDVQIDYLCQLIADQERQLHFKSHSLRLQGELLNHLSANQFSFFFFCLLQHCTQWCIIVFTGLCNLGIFWICLAKVPKHTHTRQTFHCFILPET